MGARFGLHERHRAAIPIAKAFVPVEEGSAFFTNFIPFFSHISADKRVNALLVDEEYEIDIPPPILTVSLDGTSGASAKFTSITRA